MEPAGVDRDALEAFVAVARTGTVTKPVKVSGQADEVAPEV